MKNLGILFDYLIKSQVFIAQGCLVLMTVLVVVDVFLRHTIKGSIPGAIGFSGILQAFLIFLGFALAQMDKQHIKVDLIVNKFLKHGKLRRYWDVVINVLAMTFFGLIFWESIDAFKVSYEIKEFYGGSALRVPIYPARGILLLGCLTMVIQLVRDSIQVFMGRNKA